MYPEEGVVAALEAGASKVMPVHWGSFALAMHHWKEPVDRFVNEALKCNLPMILPAQGTPASLHYEFNEGWWQGIIEKRIIFKQDFGFVNIYILSNHIIFKKMRFVQQLEKIPVYLYIHWKIVVSMNRQLIFLFTVNIDNHSLSKEEVIGRK